MKKLIIILSVGLSGCISTKIDTAPFLKAVEELKAQQRYSTFSILKLISKNDSTYQKLLKNAYNTAGYIPTSDADLLKLLNSPSGGTIRKGKDN
jgi:hypothetical protein